MFNEANTVEQMILNACQGLNWQFVSGPHLPRQAAEVFVESQLRKALIRLNSEIAVQPDRTKEVIYKLRVLPLAAQNSQLVRSNAVLLQWISTGKSKPLIGPRISRVGANRRLLRILFAFTCVIREQTFLTVIGDPVPHAVGPGRQTA